MSKVSKRVSRLDQCEFRALKREPLRPLRPCLDESQIERAPPSRKSRPILARRQRPLHQMSQSHIFFPSFMFNGHILNDQHPLLKNPPSSRYK